MKIGIDPGLSGALALLTDNDEFVEVLDMPTYQERTKTKINTYIDEVELFLILQRWKSIDNKPICSLERVGAMSKGGKKQGTTSMFKFGEGFGAVKAVIKILDIPFVLQSPVVWKREFGLVGHGKDESLPAARALVSASGQCWEKLLNLQKHNGRADAILIATMGIVK